jgi:Spy/CpxP family protein refolding chaperone
VTSLRFCAFLIFAFQMTHAVAVESAPYSGQQTRDIKALSEQEIEGYLAGKGMGFAKAAELNGYPGPLHVLEFAAQLNLSVDQRKRTEKLFIDMQTKTKAAGRALVDEERALDRLFASKTITSALLESALKRIATLQARVRAAHLETHLAQTAILSPDQVARYSELRGYTMTSGHHHKHGHDHSH